MFHNLNSAKIEAKPKREIFQQCYKYVNTRTYKLHQSNDKYSSLKCREPVDGNTT